MARRDDAGAHEYDGDLEHHSREESGVSPVEKRGMSDLAGPSAGGVPPEADPELRELHDEVARSAREESGGEHTPD